MNDLKKKLSEFSTERLIQLHSRKDEFKPETYITIETILLGRGENVPEIGKLSVESIKKKGMHTARVVRNLVLVLIVLIAGNVAIQAMRDGMGHIGLGVISVLVIIYMIYEAKKKKQPGDVEESESDRRMEEDESIQSKVKEEKLPELMVCSAEGNLERVRELIDIGANVNVRSRAGHTSLMYASRNNQIEVVKYLLDQGADHKLMSKGSVTALDLARKHGYQDIVTLLQNH